MVSLKRYAIGALIAFFVALAISFLFGPSIVGWLSGFKAQAGTLGPIAIVLIDPLLWILQNPLLGALVAGLAWPLIALELIGLFIVMIIVLGFPSAVNVVDPNQIPQF
jgi:hypothetical protein